MDRVALELRAEGIVGILEREQHTPQPVEVSLWMELDLGPAGETGNLEASINYAAVDQAVRCLIEHGRFRLIESLGLAATRLLLLPPLGGRAPIQRVHIEIRKPTILDDAVPAVVMERTMGGAIAPSTLTEGVEAEALVHLPQGGAWRVSLAPGATWESPANAVVCPWEGTLEPAGRVARGAAVTLKNTGSQTSSVLMVGQLA